MKLRSSSKLEKSLVSLVGKKAKSLGEMITRASRRNKDTPAEALPMGMAQADPVDQSPPNPFSRLPPEICEKIFGELSPVELLRASRVSKSFKSFCNNMFIWKKKSREVGIVAKNLEYKSSVIRKLKLKAAWTRGILPKSKLLKSHKQSISMLKMSGDLLVTVSWDKDIKIWNKLSSKPKFTLQGHASLLSDIKIIPSGDGVATSSYDGTIKIWNIVIGALVRSLEGHGDGVVCIDVYGDELVSGSRDQLLMLWNYKTGNLIRRFEGHDSIVNDVKYDGAKIVSGDEQGCVKVWDAATGTCLKTLTCHKTTIAKVMIQQNFAVTFSNQKQVCVYDFASGKCDHSLKTIRACPGKGQHFGNLIPLAFDKFSVKVWDVVTKQVKTTLTGPGTHEGQICGISITETFIITSGCDGKVKLWDLSTGSFIRNIVSLNEQYLTNITVSDATLVGVLHSMSGSHEYNKIFTLNFEDSAKRLTGITLNPLTAHRQK